MNNDQFKQLEALFHELSELSETERAHRINELAKTDPDRAAKLTSMFESITHDPDFLDPSSINLQIPIPTQIPVDGTTVLAGRYTIAECIGVGGSSTVFRAQATNPDRDVAIKMLRLGLSSRNARDRFDQESRALARLTHPHIAHIYETGVYTDDDTNIPWIAMELIQGSSTIMEHVKTNSMDQDQRINFSRRSATRLKQPTTPGSSTSTSTTPTSSSIPTATRRSSTSDSRDCSTPQTRTTSHQ